MLISKPQYDQKTEISPLCPCALQSVPLSLLTLQSATPPMSTLDCPHTSNKCHSWREEGQLPKSKKTHPDNFTQLNFYLSENNDKETSLLFPWWSVGWFSMALGTFVTVTAPFERYKHLQSLRSIVTLQLKEIKALYLDW